MTLMEFFIYVLAQISASAEGLCMPRGIAHNVEDGEIHRLSFSNKRIPPKSPMFPSCSCESSALRDSNTVARGCSQV